MWQFCRESMCSPWTSHIWSATNQSFVFLILIFMQVGLVSDSVVSLDIMFLMYWFAFLERNIYITNVSRKMIPITTDVESRSEGWAVCPAYSRKEKTWQLHTIKGFFIRKAVFGCLPCPLWDRVRKNWFNMQLDKLRWDIRKRFLTVKGLKQQHKLYGEML